MLNSKDRLVLLQMLEYISDIESAISRFGRNFKTFVSDKDYKNSVSMSCMQIGELKKSLSKNFINDYASYFSWDYLRRFRNQFAHSYASIDESTIWGFATRKTQELKSAINRILKEK